MFGLNLSRFLSNFLNVVPKIPTLNVASFHLLNDTSTLNITLQPKTCLTSFCRNKIRVYFPRPSERKRILRHGWNKRMSTPAGRRILMNRILKGRHVYSH